MSLPIPLMDEDESFIPAEPAIPPAPVDPVMPLAPEEPLRAPLDPVMPDDVPLLEPGEVFCVLAEPDEPDVIPLVPEEPL